MDARRNTIYTSNLEHAPEGTIVLDIDGTLLPDKSNHVPPELIAYMHILKHTHDVYVCSNGEKERTECIAQKLRLPAHIVHKPY